MFVAMTAFAQEQGVAFFGGTLDETMAKAKSEGKSVFIDFYTDWCGPCKAVADNVFPTKEAGEYFNSRFINMKIDAEKGRGPELVDKFKVQVYPTFIVLNAEGETIARWSGGSMSPTPASFIVIVEKNIESGVKADPFLNQIPQRNEPRENPGVKILECSFEEALAKAKAENKMLFVDCYTPTCGPCKMMDADVFPKKDVGDFMNSKFIFLKLDMVSEEGYEQDKILNVRAYPTYIMLGNDGNEISRFVGYMSQDAFIAKINSILDSSMTLEALQTRYDNGERDKNFMRNYIGTLGSERKYDEAKHVINELMSSLADDEKFKIENWIYWTNYGYVAATPANLDFLIEHQYKFEAGKREVTDLLVNLARSNYSMIAFGQGDGAPEFSEADALTAKLQLEHNPTIELYRSAANAKVNGDIDGLIDTYERYGRTVMDDYTQRSFIINVSMFIPGLTKKHKERLAGLTSDEQVKEILNK